MTKLLVTGSTGFIGRKLLLRLRSLQFEITELRHSHGEISDEVTWRDVPKTDVVIHLAGKTYVPDSWINPQDFLEVNLQGTVCALDYCRKHNSRLIFLSSYMYGNPEFLPIPETAELKAFNPYGLSKKLAEEVCEFYSSQYKVNVTILRPFNVYGPGQGKDFLIPFIIQQALTGSKITVQDLHPKRDYIYVEDIVNFIVDVVNAKLLGLNIFNAGTGASYSVAEIIDSVQRILGTSLSIETAGDRRIGEVMDTRADISTANALLQWEPMWTLEKGLSAIISELKQGDSEG